LVNIKEIDLSFNPLTEESIKNVLNEPKTVRRLNMAGTGIMSVPVLETPFLTHLNLSHNSISVLNEEILNKPSLLSLDVSHNDIPNLSFGLTSAWTKLRNLKYLDISHNPITFVIKGDFKYLDGLEVLKMSMLDKCTKVETGSFSNLKALKVFEMFSLPKVVFMDVRGKPLLRLPYQGRSINFSKGGCFKYSKNCYKK
jgi:Leucine-rich repeat (LRR) protein